MTRVLRKEFGYRSNRKNRAIGCYVKSCLKDKFATFLKEFCLYQNQTPENEKNHVCFANNCLNGWQMQQLIRAEGRD
jgi:hypothetical protein